MFIWETNSEKNAVFSIEMIKFQHGDEFCHQLDLCITDIYKALDGDYVFNGKPYSKKLTTTHPAILKLREVIFKRLGLKINFNINSDLAAVIPFYLNQNTILINEHFRGKKAIFPKDQNQFINKLKDQKIEGSVDLDQAKVSGVFSDYEVTLYLNFKALRIVKLTVEEITAVLLHELGHAFYACAYANRLTSFNQVLAGLIKEKLSKGKLDSSYIYNATKKFTPNITEGMINEMTNGKNYIPSSEMVKALGLSVKSISLDPRYDDTTFEMLADNFCARFGRGVEITTGLTKITRHTPENNMFVLAIRIFSDFAILALTVFVLLNLFSLVFNLFNVLILYILCVGLIGRSERFEDKTYDELYFRYKRLRNQYVQMLKDEEIDREYLLGILKNIETIDTVMGGLNTNPKILENIINIFVPGTNKIKQDIALQRLMEDLSSNDFFISSARIKTL